jgi:ABC-type transport system involved in cytochrome c biogenesis ATPase subunit
MHAPGSGFSCGNIRHLPLWSRARSSQRHLSTTNNGLMSEPLVRFRDVTKSYARVPVLERVSFDVLAGQSIGLTGQNGAGKTTLLKCMLDFCSFDSGEILINGISSRRPAARERLAFLPERFSPPWYLKGREFVRFMLRLSRTERSREDIDAMIRALGLAQSALERPVRTYSKGMTQLLGLATCFLPRGRRRNLRPYGRAARGGDRVSRPASGSPGSVRASFPGEGIPEMSGSRLSWLITQLPNRRCWSSTTMR